MIYVKDLSLKIKNETILSDINLHIEKGKITGLVGRNGCGKTMLMKCITGFVKPTSGEVVFNEKRIGEEIRNSPPSRSSSANTRTQWATVPDAWANIGI